MCFLVLMFKCNIKASGVLYADYFLLCVGVRYCIFYEVQLKLNGFIFVLIVCACMLLCLCA